MADILTTTYPWIKALHIIAVIVWMAALLCLSRLFVHHAEDAANAATSQDMLTVMEAHLLRIIANPAMILTWIFGILLIGIPSLIDWSQGWPWVKLASVVILSGFHMWLAGHRKPLAEGKHILSAKSYNVISKIPILIIAVIVFSIIVRPF
ncbi:MAG: CopD family protein [Rhodobacteraceae bacterium]|nr:CopD family protein [Paracoccaceae bacterium]